jgi:hypothetical protein
MKYDAEVRETQRKQQMTTELKQDELVTLKARATKMGIAFHPSIGLSKLRQKVDERLKSTEKPAQDPAVMSAHKLKALKRKEASRLVRINATCMNPAKKEWPGEIFTVSNSVVGTFKKYVQFNTTDGWHIPQIIFNAMKEREFQMFVKSKGLRGNEVKTHKMSKEFNIEVLPPLTIIETEELARQQAISQSVG